MRRIYIALELPKFASTRLPFEGVGFENRLSFAEVMVAPVGIEDKSNLNTPLPLSVSWFIVHVEASTSVKWGEVKSCALFPAINDSSGLLDGENVTLKLWGALTVTVIVTDFVPVAP